MVATGSGERDFSGRSIVGDGRDAMSVPSSVGREPIEILSRGDFFGLVRNTAASASAREMG